MMKKKSINFLTILLLVGLIPTITSILVLSLLSVLSLQNSLRDETFYKLEAAATGLAEHYSRIDWDTEEKDHTYVDSMEALDIELTLFHEDVRFVTSLTNKDGARIEGTKADPNVYDQVQRKQLTYTAKNVEIAGNKYYVCYVPLKDKEGMAFAGISMEHVQSEMAALIRSTMIVVVILAIVWVTIIFFVSRIVQKPLKKLADALRDLANGYVHRHTDVHTIATETIAIRDAYDTLQSNLEEIVSNIQSANSKLQEDVSIIDGNTEQTAAATEEITSTMHDIAEAATTTAANVQNINVAVSEIGNNISELSKSSDELHTTSKVIASACKETTDAMSVMATGNKKSMDATQAIITCIEDLCQSVDGIHSILAMISSVADQTKLLSLNASIEAARAGEAGRGFAVVASEIQNLSTQSNEGVEQISELAKAMLQKSQSALKLSEEIGNTMSEEFKSIELVNKTFERLFTSIDASLGMIADMQIAVTSIDNLKDTIVDDIESLGANSEENAASNEEVAATVETVAMDIVAVAEKATEIRQVADNLNESIKIFK